MVVMQQAWAWLKGLTIIHFGLRALKQLWPFLLALIFWPEIDALLSSLLPFWDEYLSEVSNILISASEHIRSIPGLDRFFAWLDSFLLEVKYRLIEWL